MTTPPSTSSLDRRAFLIGLRTGLVRTAAVFWAFPWAARAAGQTAPMAGDDTDPYVRYLRTSRDFQRVKQDKPWALAAYPSWTYMPWTYQWTIGYDQSSGEWCKAHGINGAFLDGNNQQPTDVPGKFDWINQFHLRFYMDHTAATHFLHLWDGDDVAAHLPEIQGTGIRPVPINAPLRQKLERIMETNISQVASSPVRAAYALDDETSWGAFVRPCMWQITDDARAYPAWLTDIYGAGNAPTRDKWFSYDDLRESLATWSAGEFDCSPVMDQWTFNDSYWANFLGDLVTYANTMDPHTPCGIVGGQAPNAFGGYDYAKLMRKLQYIEAYNIGGSQAIIRSFNPGLALPTVTSQFHPANTPDSAANEIWETYYYLAHGNRGHIGWVQDWFDGTTPKPWLDQAGPHWREAAETLGPLMSGATWRHDGVAIYYSQASLQLGWMMDAAAHGATWGNRNGDEKLGSSHLVRHAWENMLRDSGMQYNFVSYIDAVQAGISSEYKVLILPGTLCLSDAEAAAITAFVRAGGTLVADYLPGVWDQHGRGRPNGGVLDSLFGVHHDASLHSADVFGADTLWCEINQDTNFGYQTYQELMTNGNTCIKDPSGFDKAVRFLPVNTSRAVGLGRAVLLNLSPQWYNAYRVQGADAAAKRTTFIAPLKTAGVHRWVDVESANNAAFGSEVTYFRLPNGRTILYLVANPELTGSDQGGGNASGLQTSSLPISLVFSHPIKNVRDERAGKALPNGARFPFQWTQNEAIVLSFA